MSEQAPSPQDNPERKKASRLTDNCDGCSQDYELTPNNTFLVHYAGQQELDHLICTCTHCRYKTRMFIGEETFEAAVNNGIEPICDDRYAPLDLYNAWCKLNGIELPKTYELTNRHEAIIHKFGETILNMPPEVFWDNIEAPTEKPYPQKWID